MPEGHHLTFQLVRNSPGRSWRLDDNEQRPHAPIGILTSVEFAAKVGHATVTSECVALITFWPKILSKLNSNNFITHYERSEEE